LKKRPGEKEKTGPSHPAVRKKGRKKKRGEKKYTSRQIYKLSKGWFDIVHV